MKFDSAIVEHNGQNINVVAVDTAFFALPQEEKATLVRNFVNFFNKQPVVLIALNEEKDMQYYGRPDLTAAVSNLKFYEFQWKSNTIEE